MKTLIKTAILGIGLALLAIVDVDVVEGPDGVAINMQLMTEAGAVMGRQRRTRRRGLAIGYSAGAASGAAAATAVTAEPAPAPAPAAQPAGAPAIGTIVTALPAGCTAITMSGVQYNNCGGVYYRTAFQGSNLVYVVAQP